MRFPVAILAFCVVAAAPARARQSPTDYTVFEDRLDDLAAVAPVQTAEFAEAFDGWREVLERLGRVAPLEFAAERVAFSAMGEAEGALRRGAPVEWAAVQADASRSLRDGSGRAGLWGPSLDRTGSEEDWDLGLERLEAKAPASFRAWTEAIAALRAARLELRGVVPAEWAALERAGDRFGAGVAAVAKAAPTEWAAMEAVMWALPGQEVAR